MARSANLGTYLSFLGLLAVSDARAQASGVDAVSVDMRMLSESQRQALIDRLAPHLLPESGHLLVAPRKDITESLSTLLPAGAPMNLTLTPFEGLERSLARIQRVYGPERAAASFGQRLTAIRSDCIRIAKGIDARYAECFSSAGGPQFEGLIAALSSDGAPCETAATRYERYLSDCSIACPSGAVTILAAFDSRCLASNLPWRRPDGAFRSDPEPRLFRSGGARNGAQGMFSAVVLIEVDSDAGLRSHLCGGLLLSGNRVLTAAHCFATTLIQEALGSGRVYGRLIRSDNEERYPLQAITAPGSQISSPAEDFIVLNIRSAQPLVSPRIEFHEPSKPAAAVVLGYFSDYDTTRDVALTDSRNELTIPTWRQGLRWPKPGLCHVIETVAGCVRTLCQTIAGYSGAPVFSLESDPDSPLVVYGVISGPDSSTARCGKVQPLTTLAASAKDTRP